MSVGNFFYLFSSNERVARKGTKREKENKTKEQGHNNNKNKELTIQRVSTTQMSLALHLGTRK